MIKDQQGEREQTIDFGYEMVGLIFFGYGMLLGQPFCYLHVIFYIFNACIVID